MSYQHVKLPAGGQKISIAGDKLVVPDQPILGYVEGDGIGIDITPACLRIWDAAVAKAYGGKRKVHWCEIYLGEKAQKLYGGNYFPDETLAAIKEGVAKQLILDGDGDRRTLQIGEKLWPIPFPIVKGDDGKWAFDTYAGLEEIVNRYVGENELTAIETTRAYIDAQEDYAVQDRDEDGVEEFAQKLISSEGATDGLYWPTDEINGESPAGDFVVQAELGEAEKGEGYFGYKYKILTGQGDQIAGGAYDYVINGNMIGGFGLIAWPAKYGETGVKTFAVNQHGVVYETDLGPTTEQIVKHIDRFNPDDTWEVVAD